MKTSSLLKILWKNGDTFFKNTGDSLWFLDLKFSEVSAGDSLEIR